MARKITKAIEVELDVIYQGRPLVLKVWPGGVLGLRLKGQRAIYTVSISNPSFTGLKTGDLVERKENRKLRDIIADLIGIYRYYFSSLDCGEDEADVCHRFNKAAAAIGWGANSDRRSG